MPSIPRTDADHRGRSSEYGGNYDYEYFGAEWSGVRIRGYASCSDIGGSVGSVVDEDDISIDFNDNDGPNCWCMLESYNGLEVSSKWVLVDDYDSQSDCETFCTMSCYNALGLGYSWNNNIKSKWESNTCVTCPAVDGISVTSAVGSTSITDCCIGTGPYTDGSGTFTLSESCCWTN